MTKQDDGLFLLEVLIDKITFTKIPCFSDKDFRTCVNVACMDVDPLEICDDEPGVCESKSAGRFVKNFNSGKSCLFSLKESDITKAMSSFPLKITVYKNLPCGCLPNKVVIGEATIDMTKEFVQTRNTFLEDPQNVSYQALKDSFKIHGTDGAEIGDIVMFFRISCFGKLITTRFQGTGGPPKLTSGSKFVDRSCNEPKAFQSKLDPCVCDVGRHAAGSSSKTGHPCPTAPNCTKDPCSCSGHQPPGNDCYPGQSYYSSMPCEDPDDPCYCSGPKKEKRQPLACRNTDPYCLHVPKGRSKQFEEIGMTLTGNELKIKVPANSAVIKKISQTHCAMQCPFTKGKEEGFCETPCGKNQISLALPCEDTCCHGAQLANTQFTCTTEGCIQTSKHGQQTALARGDTKTQEANLVNTNVFVFKLAKTALQGDRKCKLELELVTPKGPDKKPPIQKRSIRMQSEPDCGCCHRKSGKKKR